MRPLNHARFFFQRPRSTVRPVRLLPASGVQTAQN